MSETSIRIEKTPELNAPMLVAGFEGWADAMGVSSGMANYLVRKLQAQAFARLNPDLFFRYDDTRPIVTITGGTLKSVLPPGGTFYAADLNNGPRDLVILKCVEPAMRWQRFTEELLSLCHRLGIKQMVTIGSMYDNVLHEDRIISAIASDDGTSAFLKKRGITPVHYQGPGAIQSVLQHQGQSSGLQSVSLWAHCPQYLQGTTHFGMLAGLASIISELGEFDLNFEDLEASWQELQLQIQELIESKPELNEIISKLRQEKEQGLLKELKSEHENEKVINLKDFLDPKEPVK